MSAVIAYVGMVGGAIGLALALFFAFRAIKLI